MRKKLVNLMVGAIGVSSVYLGYRSIRFPRLNAESKEILQDVPRVSGIPWDSNWDRRAIQSCVKPPGRELDLEDYEKRLVAAYPTAVRNIILVRHGQYEERTKEKWLTDKGREQAELAGKYLMSLDLPITKIVWSAKNRATETGKILSKYFEGVPTQSCQLLEEGSPPVLPEPGFSGWSPPASLMLTDGTKMEAAFRKYFHRASASQKEDSYEILSCHGNVIRYCVLRALQLPPEAWLNLAAYNASITWVQIAPNGNVNMLRFGDTGFISPEKVTYALDLWF